MSEYHDIGWAVKQLWDGKKVFRKEWNGKNMYLVLVRHSRFYPIGQEDQPAYLKAEPFVVMKTAQEKYQPGWVCSQADLLALDWECI